MDQYPNEDEEYELQYQDELELLEDLQNLEVPANIVKSKTNEPKQYEDVPVENTSLQLSQVFPNTQNVSGISTLSNPVNRRLFGTPTGPQRGCSTPMVVQKRIVEPIKNILNDLDEPITENPNSELQEQRFGCKRRLEEQLFGNIDDLYINQSYEDPVAKKARTEEEHDLEEIQKILEARKRYLQSNEVFGKENLTRLQELHDFKMKNLSYSIPPWPFLILRRVDDQSVFVRYHSEEYETRQLESVSTSVRIENILGESKQQLWKTANEILNRRLNEMDEQVDPQNVTIVESNAKGEELWVEKYKPSKYIELLSDESTNRSLLYWIKMWDKVVFGKEFTTKQNANSTGELNSFNKRTGKFESNGGWKKRKDRTTLNTNIDDFGRPVQKVAILCGPPGLGKTTLAHTIAHHAGYNVLEVNASDDRSPAAFRAALENGTQMTAVLNKNRRPNCIILDEIDGAPRQSIEFLVKFVTDGIASKTRTKGGGSKRIILKRPIICICNDVYDSALRSLRQIAFVATFPPIESARLAERLMQIVIKERLKTDFFSLIALAEKSGNDVRSCMSTLQFFSAQKKPLTLKDVLRSNLGEKDRHQGLFDIWGAVFRIQRPKKQLQTCATDEGDTQVTMSDMSVSTRVANVLNVVHSAGDYERLIQGIHENYLHQKMPATGLNAVVEALQWFCFSDALNRQISQQQNYTIYPYYQYGFVAWHLQFASLAWPKIKFPTQSYEFHQKQTTQLNIFQSLRKGLSPQLQGIGVSKYFLTEAVPYIKRILAPQLRSVPIQLLSSKELENLNHTIQIMIDLGITYTQVKGSEGAFVFQMEPDMDSLSTFIGYPVVKLNYFGRQLISREVMLESIRRVTPKITEQKEKPKKAQNHLQVLKPKLPDGKLKSSKAPVTTNFFRNFQRVRVSAAADSEEPEEDPIVKSPVWYRYKEGFNNAVRKNVHLRELL